VGAFRFVSSPNPTPPATRYTNSDLAISTSQPSRWPRLDLTSADDIRPPETRQAMRQHAVDCFGHTRGRMAHEVTVSDACASGSSPERSSYGLDYWLGRCERFRVYSPHGRVGLVKELRCHTRVDRPDWLVVAVGLFHRRELLVPVDEVETIDPTKQRVRVRKRPA